MHDPGDPFAGILAAFAFAAVVQTLTRPSNDSKRDAHVVSALLSAFVGLLLATLLYAVLAGEREDAFVNGRGATEEVLAGVVLGFAALILIYAIGAMIESRSAGPAADQARLIVGLLLPAYFLGRTVNEKTLLGGAARLGRNDARPARGDDGPAERR